MKRTIRIFSICLIIVMLTSMLSACDASKKFVGTWEEVESGATLVLANDGTGSVSEDGMSGSVTWSVEKDKIFLTVSVCGMTETTECTYEFSGDTMTLTDAEGEVTVYKKVK